MENVHIILGAPKQEKIAPLITEKGIIIGVDRGALLAIEEGLTVDVAIGDFDSLSDSEKEKVNSKAKETFHFSSDKDDTDAELALLYVLKHYPKANVHLYNWYGGRIDHLYSILLLAIQERFKPLVLNLHYISAKNMISYYLPGEYTIARINGMDYLSYILLTDVEDLSLNDVKYTLNEESFDRPSALISNEFINDQANFSFAKGIVAAVQSRD